MARPKKTDTPDLTFGGDAPLTMSSLEISELTGKEHKNVIRDIRAMLDELKKDGSDLRHVREDKFEFPQTVVSSPRPWGCFWIGPQLLGKTHVFPTPVGVFPPGYQRQSGGTDGGTKRHF